MTLASLVPGGPETGVAKGYWAGTHRAIAPADTVARWSTDPRSRIPALPRLTPGAPLPVCRRTVHRGVTIHG